MMIPSMKPMARMTNVMKMPQLWRSHGHELVLDSSVSYVASHRIRSAAMSDPPPYQAHDELSICQDKMKFQAKLVVVEVVVPTEKKEKNG
jgi:hypothetical protein